MKICPRCGKPFTDADRFCTGCGLNLDAYRNQQQAPQQAPQAYQGAQQQYQQGAQQAPQAYQPQYQQQAYQQPYEQAYQPAYQQSAQDYSSQNYFDPGMNGYYQQPQPEPQGPKKTGLIVAISCLGVLLVGIVVALIVVLTKPGKEPATASNSLYEEELSEPADAQPEPVPVQNSDPTGTPVDGSSVLQEAEQETSPAAEAEQPAESTQPTESEAAQAEASQPAEQPAAPTLPVVASLPRPSLMAGAAQLYDQSLVPSVPEYSVAPDFSNVINKEIVYMSDEAKAMLVQNGFVVMEGGGKEFFERYESNRYMYMANFVTVDSMMHTYHLYFAYLMRNTEKNYLGYTLSALSEQMLSKSVAQYEALKGTEWEQAALRNVAFFCIGARLQNESIAIPAEVQAVVESELALIMEHTTLVESPLTGIMEDYSQYKPRGYYEGDPQLEAYFRAMMWYGRLNFKQKEEDLDRSALLMTLAMDQDTLPAWESIYAITSFFAGTSDDSGYYEYKPIIDAAYGAGVTAADLPGKTDAWNLFHTLTGQLEPPRINSVPMMDDGGATDKVVENLGYRFMGQRFTLDEAIFQNLTYSKVGEKSENDRRMLPDVLDAAAAMGSEKALSILEQQGATSYPGYLENMQALREEVKNSTEEQWNASLYSSWLHTLQPLLKEKGAGYPGFMQTGLWAQKTLETFAGSFTELKHDTVLYAKQMMAEMGGGEIPVVDDRGYVEPEPEIFSRLAVLTDRTASGLKGYGMLSENDEQNLGLLSSLARQLMVISEKELRNETLTDEEYELIRTYGGNLEHFWQETVKDLAAQYDDATLNRPDQFPAALVVDVATDPNGQCLELATYNPATIYVACLVDGQVKICSGSVYSFYQFSWPSSDRLTDSQWRIMMGIQMGEDGSYNYDAKPVSKPAWTMDYRYTYD